MPLSISHCGKALGLPEAFVDKVPEDGLSGLTDEDNLSFSYEVLDRYIREGACDDATLKTKIDRLRMINLHKLEPIPFFNYKSIKSD